MSKGRNTYEVRVRECVVPGRFVGGKWIDGTWVKKSKFYTARDPKDAAKRYKGKGKIMWVQKVAKGKLFGIGSFFKLGDELLRELRSDKGSLVDQIKEKRSRGYYGTEETTTNKH